MSQPLYKKQIQKLKDILSQGLLEKDEIIGLVLLCMIAGKSVFLYGPPGTAKSLIARRVSCAFQSNKFFDYLMNRFSTPEEVFGALRLSELRQDRLVRNIDGFLPSADFAFLDEIWKSSPAILNALLTIINEKKFRNGVENIAVPLRGLIAASNELPQKGQSLEALYDRFIMRLIVAPLRQKSNFKKLLQSVNVAECVEIPNNLLLNNDELELVKSRAQGIKVDSAILDILELLRLKIDDFNAKLDKNDSKSNEISQIYISERRWVAVMELLRFSAVLNDRDCVDLSDLFLLKHCLWSEEIQKSIIERFLSESFIAYAQKIAPLEKKYDKLKKEVEAILSGREVICRTENIKGRNFIKFTKTLTTREGIKTLDIYANEAHLNDSERNKAYIFNDEGKLVLDNRIYYKFDLANEVCEFFVDENAQLYEWDSQHFMRFFDAKRGVSLKSISSSPLPIVARKNDFIATAKDSLLNKCDTLCDEIKAVCVKCEAQLQKAQDCDNIFAQKGESAMIANALNVVKDDFNQLIIEAQKLRKKVQNTDS